jgi:hypothetical protein
VESKLVVGEIDERTEMNFDEGVPAPFKELLSLFLMQLFIFTRKKLKKGLIKKSGY